MSLFQPRSVRPLQRSHSEAMLTSEQCRSLALLVSIAKVGCQNVRVCLSNTRGSTIFRNILSSTLQCFHTKKNVPYHWKPHKMRRKYLNQWFTWTTYRYPLTLNIQGPRYPDLNRTVLLLLMPWLLVLQGHQQIWQWLCKLDRSLS